MQAETPLNSLTSEGDDTTHHPGAAQSVQCAHKVGCRSAGVPRPQDGVMCDANARNGDTPRCSC